MQSQPSPKICHTAEGILIHDNKVLLIKHKKLQIWLPPGGHQEKDEFLHQTSEREFLEETGIKVKAFSSHPLIKSKSQKFHPIPINIGLHWISPQNYSYRLKSAHPNRRTRNSKWPKGCEKHLSHMFLVQSIEKPIIKLNSQEADDVQWFTLSKLQASVDNDLFKTLQIALNHHQTPNIN